MERLQDGRGGRWRAGVLVVALVLSACSSVSSDRTADESATAAVADRSSAAPDPSADSSGEVAADDPTAAPSGTPAPDRSPTPTPSEEDSDAGADGDAEADGEEAEEDSGATIVEVAEGDTGEAVALLQERLTARGFDAGPADGVAGHLTVTAIEAFQAHADLPVTGVADAATLAALDDERHSAEVLSAGASGEAVERLQSDLAAAPFDPGPADGVFGDMTVEAVYALQKLTGLAVDGDVDGVDRYTLDRLLDGAAPGRAAAHTTHDRRWVDIDLSRQVMAVYDAGEPDVPILTSHISSGNGERWCNDSGVCGVAATPTGSFTINRRIAGWRESSLDIGALYNPLYFRGGIALHGARSVPLYPASHGCVRVPMHIAEYLPGLLPNGTPVDVHW